MKIDEKLFENIIDNLGKDKKLSIPNTIAILAETKDMEFLLDEKNL